MKYVYLLLLGLIALTSSLVAQTPRFEILESYAGRTSNVATAISGDGRVVVGFVEGNFSLGLKFNAFRWVDGVMDSLPTPSGYSKALGVSRDGSTIVRDRRQQW